MVYMSTVFYKFHVQPMNEIKYQLKMKRIL